MDELNRMQTTRRFPRTLEQAFGAHTNREIFEEPAGSIVCYRVCVVGVLLMVALLLAGLL